MSNFIVGTTTKFSPEYEKNKNTSWNTGCVIINKDGTKTIIGNKMETLLEQINKDITSCRLSRSQPTRVAALTMLKSELLNNQKADKVLPEINVVLNYVKQLKKAAISYTDEQSLAKFEYEINTCSEFLPELPSDEEIKQKITELKTTITNTGLLMKELKILFPFVDGKHLMELSK